MIFRLFFSTSRTAFPSNFNNGLTQYQKRNFRRLASTTAPTTTVPLASGIKFAVAPGVSIIPRRAPGPYALFVQEKMINYKNNNPTDFKISQFSKTIAEEWHKLGTNGKKRYEEESKRLQKEMEDAYANMTNQEFREVVLQEMERVQRQRITSLRRQQKELKQAYDYPHADSAFFKLQFAAKEHSGQLSPSFPKMKAPDRGKEMGKLWASLPEDEKKKYEKQEKDSRSKYKQAIKSWESQMQKRGLAGVVKKINLRTTKTLLRRGRQRRSYLLASRKKVLGSKVGAKKRAIGTAKRGKKRTTKKA